MTECIRNQSTTSKLQFLTKKKVIKCENDSPAFNTGSKNITYIFLTHFISFWTIKIIESQVFIGI